ncbi:LiaF transmembrane domain-containing protein [Herbinix luporum]|jgi:predicted membrane protein|uniref:Putative membrane protein n=1 Tax=Herbinix luporum TaxID=1679721 RepID=A0A0K8J7K2_9FIRM|nr:LiaF domain-containing protein [Herbinix luporum]MDI9487800.1 LiaF-related protein [Bacillota bacterium]CUH93636.1 putative membrane protein [Herbinix luporum]HHT56903.1 cell wall-active antibiotics response protein [Herbinix luporum]
MRNKLSNLIWGIIFIVVGVGIAGDAMQLWDFTLFFPGWWTLFIIIPCLLSLIQNGFNIGAITGLIIGAMLFASRYVSFNINYWRLIVPIILISIGLKIIFQEVFKKTIRFDNTVHVEGQENFHNINRKEYNAIFASNNIKIDDQFMGTSLNAIFGGIALDLRDAIITCDVEISATAIFGGIDIYLPKGVQVKINNIPVFGGVSNKAVYNGEPSDYTIYINSTTMFGGIDIR